uniref:Caspase domain-containing protein n=1 Tax=Candidatus Kentrum sp. DK TaxID=2126562 RepID=A0A450T3P4_9GAMM|nr:MAG: Caspase domain-containing protein [Candidatus Kentron sp. DK]
MTTPLIRTKRRVPISIILGSLLLGFIIAPLHAEGRGKPLGIRNPQGTQVGLYQESHALVIGVSGYRDGWPKLPGVQKDVQVVSQALRDNGFQVETVQDPDSGALKRAFEDFISRHGRNPENRLLFYFAGHGHTVKPKWGGDPMGYIVPRDAPDPQQDPGRFEDLALPMQRIEEYALKIHAKHAIFLFDSCFSGSLFAITRSVPENISYKTLDPVRQFITAGGADETVPDQSIFRRQFIAALAGEGDRNRDGFVTGLEMGEFLQETVINYSKGGQHPQYGKIRNPYLDKGDFVFVTGKADKTSADGKDVEMPDEAGFETGFQYPDPEAQSEENLISPGRVIGGDYRIVNDRPWRRKTLVRLPEKEIFQPRAKVVDGDLFIVYLEKPGDAGPSRMYLKEYNARNGRITRVDTLHYDGGGYHFSSNQNLKIVGDFVYYFADSDADSGGGRKYRIGSGAPATEEDLFYERDDWLMAAVSPNGRYIAAANSGGYADFVLEGASKEFRLAIGDGKGEFTGISLYDRASKQRNVLFRQEYTGDWSIGKILWSDDSARIYFDNSGAVACIWEYDVPERLLSKIVPEHGALHPFFFRYKNKDYILYVENGNALMVATR